MIDLASPTLSVCVPTLGGWDRISRLAASLAAHTASDYELVVVDSGSRTRGWPKPMNQALRGARGKVLVALNDDVEVTAGWDAPLVVAALANPETVAAPDQRSTDGEQVMCGWCVAMSREFYRGWGGYDDRFVFWCSDIDLAKWTIGLGHPPLRVRIPEPLRHELNGTPRTDDLVRDAHEDLARYESKWGSSALEDKARLQSVDWTP